MHALSEDDQAAVDAFFEAVNMPTASLERWLATAEAQALDAPLGARIVELLRRRTSDYGADDFACMRQVVRVVRELLARRPVGDAHVLQDAPWRRQLMNWGHDPLAD